MTRASPLFRALVLSGVFLSGTAAAAESAGRIRSPAGVTLQKAGDKTVLADANGLTLYVFAKDTVLGQSACEGHCAVAWPPLAAAPDAKPSGAWTIIVREDESRQWAYKGKPLYTFRQWDVNPGDARGDGVGGRWLAATP